MNGGFEKLNKIGLAVCRGHIGQAHDCPRARSTAIVNIVAPDGVDRIPGQTEILLNIGSPPPLQKLFGQAAFAEFAYDALKIGITAQGTAVGGDRSFECQPGEPIESEPRLGQWLADHGLGNAIVPREGAGDPYLEEVGVDLIIVAVRRIAAGPRGDFWPTRVWSDGGLL